MTIQYANIIIDIVHEKLDRVFQYRIPKQLISSVTIGMEVEVPFGKGNRVVRGWVIDLTDIADYEEGKIKDIIGIAESAFTPETQMIQLAAWIRNTYGSTMTQALKTVIPIRQRVKEKENKTYVLAVEKEEAQRLLEKYEKKRATAKMRLVCALLTQPLLEASYIRQELGVSASTIKSLLEEQVIAENRNRIFRNPIPSGFDEKEDDRKQEAEEASTAFTLTEEQQHAISVVREDIQRGQNRVYLLHGITGSGKTEVYIDMIEQTVRQGRQAIMLIPEIALTYQTVERFYRRFHDRVSVIHSRLSKGEKYDQFMRAQAGEIDIVIGPRSALFTPFTNLGMIIIDEEHEAGYKSETVPKYHARETAIKRAEICGASVVLGSATPSVAAYDRAKRGEYILLELTKRAKEQGLAKVYVEDLRKELLAGNRSVFSRHLRQLMEDRLKKKEQILLFLNRRGYAGFISCRSCGEAIKCPHCDVSLSLHKNGRMICHYCGYETPQVKKCPKCGSAFIGGFRIGTEQVEELVKQEFPQARVLRMDMDTTRTKHGHEQIVTSFSNQEADILIGTQMIVKGHDFPKVTLVGILAADLSLRAGTYTASERTFQLLTQAAGRAGRGKLLGEVIIQTYSPEHYAVKYAQNQDYKGFFEEEMRFRRAMLYPPAGHILEIFFSGQRENELCKMSEQIKHMLTGYMEGMKEEIRMIGPAPAAISRINDFYRRVIYVKAQEEEILVQIRKRLERELEIHPLVKGIQINYDFM